MAAVRCDFCQRSAVEIESPHRAHRKNRRSAIASRVVCPCRGLALFLTAPARAVQTGSRKRSRVLVRGSQGAEPAAPQQQLQQQQQRCSSSGNIVTSSALVKATTGSSVATEDRSSPGHSCCSSGLCQPQQQRWQRAADSTTTCQTRTRTTHRASVEPSSTVRRIREACNSNNKSRQQQPRPQPARRRRSHQRARRRRQRTTRHAFVAVFLSNRK